MNERAPAKINLCLFLGPVRAHDGRHELVTVMEPLELADTVTLRPAEGGADEVVCTGVDGPNLAARALAAFREHTGWDGPPVRLEVDKRIPVAAGMAGGSADAGAALRLAHRVSGLGDDALLHRIAGTLGADVPAQVRPGRVLATGAGERLRRMAPARDPYGVLVLPSAQGLPTGSVFAEADRLGLPRDAAGLADALADVEAAAGDPPIVNELAPAALSLRPGIADALAAAREAGARHVLVSGSGPTVVGLFDAPGDAARAAGRLGDRTPPPIATRPLRR
jgi:4-diphosphocytidyl-2-C-methyl-D-erythritol kinase